jgi:hypothetical protein
VSFSGEQVEQLLRAINPRRVMHANNQAHVSQQDVRAHLIRVFGFGGWDTEIISLSCVRDEWTQVPGKRDADPPRKVPAVTYICQLRLVVWCPTRCCRKISEEVGTGTSPNLPSYGDAVDFAAKNAVSYALKRCAINLGDQFGLSLYNKGQVTALVGGTLVGQPGEHAKDARAPVDHGVEQQVSLGDYEGTEGQDEDPPAPAAPAPGPLTKALTADLLRHGSLLGLAEGDVRVRFARAYGATIAEASTEQLSAFRDQLRAEAQQQPVGAPG